MYEISSDSIRDECVFELDLDLHNVETIIQANNDKNYAKVVRLTTSLQ